jgi:hypothetical protein
MTNKTIVIALKAAGALAALSLVGRTVLLSSMSGGFLWFR